MGAAESTPVLGGHEELLETFVGSRAVPLHDPFWDRLLSFSYALPKIKPEDFDEATREACTTLALNNRQTFHFGKLLVHMMKSLSSVPDCPTELPLKAVNTVYFTRLFVKHLVEYYDNKEIWEHMILNLTPDEASQAGLDSSLAITNPAMSTPGRQDLLVPAIRSLLAFTAAREINVHSYLLHLEVINLLLVMCSTQLHGSVSVVSSDAQLFIQAAMAQDDLAAPFVKKLLVNFISRLALPPRVPYYIPTLTGRQGVLRRFGSAAVAVFLLPYYTYSLFMNPSQNPSAPGRTPLADNSLLLLLVLTHYGRILSLGRPSDKDPQYQHRGRGSGGEGAGEPGVAEDAGAGAGGGTGAGMRPLYHPNPFKSVLYNACDTKFESSGPKAQQLGKEELPTSMNGGGPSEDLTSSLTTDTVKIPFPALYDSLGSSLTGDTATLLLYSLVHGNSAFLDYCLVRSDLDTMLVPLLEMLYNAPRRTANQIYMLLIILLILSQDSSFNANVHKLILPTVPWYKERLLTRISLGSLMVIILIRTVKYNLSRLRDVYLHTNCLATLANMAPHVHNLNSYASQRLVSLFHMLAKKYTKLSQAPTAGGKGREGQAAERDGGAHLGPDEGGGARLSAGSGAGERDRERESSSSGVGGVGGSERGLSETGPSESDSLLPANSDSGGVDAPSELHIYTDFLRIVLEIINAILTYALPRNPEFVYALLHRQELFVAFRNHPRFYELLENIFTVIDFFNVRMDDKVAEGEWSVEKVLQIVVANARTWRGEGMQMFTELKFTYEEELHPEEFFVPYVWTLVVAHSGIPWNPDCITMFPVRPNAEQLEDVYDADAFDTHSELGRPTPKEDV